MVAQVSPITDASEALKRWPTQAALVDAYRQGLVTQKAASSAEARRAAQEARDKRESLFGARTSKPLVVRMIHKGEEFGSMGTIATADMLEVSGGRGKPVRHTIARWQECIKAVQDYAASAAQDWAASQSKVIDEEGDE